MKVLIVVGSKRGGTAEIGDWLAAALRNLGFNVDVRPAQDKVELAPYQVVLVGGSLYMFRWHHHSRRFVEKNAAALRQRAVWFFSSGPLDDSAAKRSIPPLPQVQRLMNLVAANGHITFGGRLEPDSRSVLAREHSGDWRDRQRVEAWASAIAQDMAAMRANPRPRVVPPVESRARGMLALCTGIGLCALGGGAALVTFPDGSALGLPLALLTHSPFSSFLVPGLVLALGVGVAHLWAAWLYWRRDDFAPLGSMASGLTLLGWIVVQMIMLRTMHPLQLLFLGLAVGVVVRSGLQLTKFISSLGLARRSA